MQFGRTSSLRTCHASMTMMNANADLRALVQKAQGIFMPEYAEGAALVGGKGGQGILFVRNNDTWQGPALYNVGGISLGAQVGGKAGQVAMLLMSQAAVDRFREQNNFSFDANAGLTIVDCSQSAEASAADRDVILWSDAEGAFAGASLGVTDIAWNDDENAAWYGQPVDAAGILSGSVTSLQADNVKSALPDPSGM
jgi:SH3 domain-containing YSC84-like protein 1